MNVQPAALLPFDFFEPLPIQIEVSDAPLTSDAGLLPLRQFDQRIGLTKQFAAVLDEPRDPGLLEHSFTDMVRMRIFGILAGYQDSPSALLAVMFTIEGPQTNELMKRSRKQVIR